MKKSKKITITLLLLILSLAPTQLANAATIYTPVAGTFQTEGTLFKMNNPYPEGKVIVQFDDQSVEDDEIVELEFTEQESTYLAKCSSLYTFSFYDQDENFKLKRQYYVPYPRYSLDECNKLEQ
ncbi:hypothetical protein [Bacillus solimangrovi]|uniref:Uncharacterized protein n=1 Tax=Bacillus solimangrovi TaxID=1305675 RepID=A0A1E5LEN0_9BACI|nr:hypothetical protein [Bacillus solimangrovi]OEH92538.1 hypothetical protein BFG57_15495 [Bacillus solimangrovi]